MPEILYEDNHVVAVMKPAGVPVQRDKSGDPSVNDDVKQYLKEKFGKPGNVYASAVHRLDRPASGVVLVAKTDKAAARLSEAFRTHDVKKTYLVVVEGTPRAAEERLFGWILKNAASNTSRMTRAGAKGARDAALTYRVLGGQGGFHLLEVDLETGRSHQIRVQLADAGMPVAGDRRYGAKTGFGPLLALHAARLEFPHPTRGERISVSAPPPARWKEIFGDWIFKVLEETYYTA